MALNTKIIGGLAWAGLVVVLAVPSADIVSSQLSPKSPLQITADTDQIQTASIGDPVDAFAQSGKPLPSYLSDTPAPPPKPMVRVLPPSGASTPASVNMPTVPSAAPAETEVAAIAPMPPMPYPASMRPKAPLITEPVVTEPVVVEEEVAALPTVDEPTVRRTPAAVEPRYVTEDELADWDSGSLADYLETRGLIADASYEDSSSAEYDPDGFFLDQGPNDRAIRSRSRNRRDFDEGYFLVFPD